MPPSNLRSAVEALLFSSDQPLPSALISEALESPDEAVADALRELGESYAAREPEQLEMMELDPQDGMPRAAVAAGEPAAPAISLAEAEAAIAQANAARAEAAAALVAEDVHGAFAAAGAGDMAEASDSRGPFDAESGGGALEDGDEDDFDEDDEDDEADADDDEDEYDDDDESEDDEDEGDEDEDEEDDDEEDEEDDDVDEDAGGRRPGVALERPDR